MTAEQQLRMRDLESAINKAISALEDLSSAVSLHDIDGLFYMEVGEAKDTIADIHKQIECKHPGWIQGGHPLGGDCCVACGVSRTGASLQSIAKRNKWV